MRRILLESFAVKHSLALQQTLYYMGEQVLSAHPEVAEIRMSMPNKHHFLVDLSPFGLPNDDEVYYAADRPYGLIEGTVTATTRRRPGAPGRPCPASEAAGLARLRCSARSARSGAPCGYGTHHRYRQPHAPQLLPARPTRTDLTRWIGLTRWIRYPLGARIHRISQILPPYVFETAASRETRPRQSLQRRIVRAGIGAREMDARREPGSARHGTHPSAAAARAR